MEPPKDRGPDALRYLKENGWPTITPNARSSDADDARSNPFAHLLKRRFGLQPAYNTSDALEHGSWCHTHFQNMFDVSSIAHANCLADAALEQKHREIESRCGRCGIGAETCARLKDAAGDNMLMTGAWMNAAARVPIPNYSSMGEFILHKRWTLVSKEICYDLRMVSPALGPDDTVPFWCTIQPDRLIFDESSGKLYVVDLKTCKEPTTLRGLTCPFEFQTWHYVYTAAELLARGAFHQWYGLPADATMGGMYHILMQKPTIKMCSVDKPYRFVAHSKRKKRMGRAVEQHGGGGWIVDHWPDDQSPQVSAIRSEHDNEEDAVNHLQHSVGVKAKRKSDDEPSVERYAARCWNWYQAEGEHIHLKIERDAPVLISYTDADLMIDPDVKQEYHDTLSDLRYWGTCPPYPSSYRKNYSALRAYNALSPYAPFFVNPIADWPALASEKNFIFEHRDDPDAMPTDDTPYQQRRYAVPHI